MLGYHLEQAFRHRTEVRGMDDISRGLAARGGRQLAAAGRRAVARGDAPAAVNLLERAGALLPEEAPKRLELRLELADALHEAGSAPPRWGAARRGAESGRGIGQRRARGTRTARTGVPAPSSTRRGRPSTTFSERPSTRRRCSSSSETTPGLLGRLRRIVHPLVALPGGAGRAAARTRSRTRSAQVTNASCPRSVRH